MPRTNLNGVRDLGTITAADIDGIGEAQGKKFRNVKTSQLRAFYSAVNRIRVQSQQNDDFSPLERRLILLKPKLAYAAGRHNTLKSFQSFQSFMVQAIDGVVNSNAKKQALTNFFDLLEAVVAYHKFHGGQDK